MNQRCQRFSGGPQSSRTSGATFLHVVQFRGWTSSPQTHHPETVVPGKRRSGCCLVGRLPRTNVHRTKVTARKTCNSLAAPAGVSVQAAACSPNSLTGSDECVRLVPLCLVM
jgi:hypothetical protein